MFKKAFTMVELIVTMAIIAILVLVTVPIAKNKMYKADKYSYYLGYAVVKDIAANIVAQESYDYNWSDYASVPITINTAKNLCEKIRADYNIASSNCDASPAEMILGVIGGFQEINPHIKLSNGVKIYMLSDLTKLEFLADALDVRDRIAYLLYVDVNGNKGHGIPYQDVFPFYILSSGKVLPEYNYDGVGGANNVEDMSVNVLYDSYDADGNRSIKVSQTNLNFKTGACATGYIKSVNYCGAIEADPHCADVNADCRLIVNKPMKFFGR